ncbi:transmembrane 220 family protein [Pontibacter chitinilyticus]|uniref:transmembrane 220 family protein n=1 Tax=Pontibacter chitinilyticus TaxID=2674989 RepID=UPI0032190040
MKIYRVFFGLCALVLALFTYWQFNDPDAAFWGSMYGVAAVLAGMAAFGKFSVPLLLAEAIYCLFGFVYKYPSSVSTWVKEEWMQKDLSMKTYSMEQARESFGMLIVAVVMLLAVAAAYYENRKAAASSGFRTADKTRAVAR